jgi:hypothetical protein
MEDPQTNGRSKSRSAPTKSDPRKTATMLLVLVGSPMALWLKAARRRAALSLDQRPISVGCAHFKTDKTTVAKPVPICLDGAFF